MSVLRDFVDERVIPSVSTFHSELESSGDRWAWTRSPTLATLRTEARAAGLWNLFLPGPNGAGLTNLQYAPLAEITGRALELAPAAVNCAAPDTGNMEVLEQFGTPEQKERWLTPLLEGHIRSAFAMTEPAVASSDATNIET
ncbi:MAG: acyl-CoA dehydrogenase family protein, partial [Allobranchiibius sp.]